MELYTAGFNAWNQLSFGNGSHRNDSSGESNLEPDDVTSFTRNLFAETIGRPVSHLSYTLVEADGKILVAGFLDTSDAGSLARLYHSASTATGKTLVLDTQRRVTLPELADGGDEAPLSTQADSLPVKQLAAYDTGFAALLEDGSVWVNGDERFPNCLGGSSDSGEVRKPNAWNRVHWLDDLPTGPIVKIAAGGYTLAALTEGGDLYCWGSRPGQKPLFEDLSNVPIPIDLGVEADVKDVALGDHHIIVLTTDRRVLVRGSNKNGQLGLGSEVGDEEAWVEEWQRIKGISQDGQCEIIGVAAGPRTSFITTQGTRDKQSIEILS